MCPQSKKTSFFLHQPWLDENESNYLQGLAFDLILYKASLPIWDFLAPRNWPEYMGFLGL